MLGEPALRHGVGDEHRPVVPPVDADHLVAVRFAHADHPEAERLDLECLSDGRGLAVEALGGLGSQVGDALAALEVERRQEPPFPGNQVSESRGARGDALYLEELGAPVGADHLVPQGQVRGGVLDRVQGPDAAHVLVLEHDRTGAALAHPVLDQRTGQGDDELRPGLLEFAGVVGVEAFDAGAEEGQQEGAPDDPE